MAGWRPGTSWFMLVGVVVLGLAWRPMQAQPEFVVAPEVTPSSTPSYHDDLAWRPEGVAQIHGSSLAALPDGDLLLVYYGGSSESALDVKLYQTRYHAGTWSTPTVLLTAQQVGQATHRYTRRVGNSSLHRDVQGRLHLFFVSVGYFGWSCSSINQMTSTDEGQSWSPARRLLTSPFFNISTLVRSPAVPLRHGGFLLPVYYELTNKFPEAIEFDTAGNMVGKTRLTGEHGTLQACIVPTSSRQAIAYSRNRLYEDNPRLMSQRTGDAGQHWSAPAALEVSNLDSPVAAARLAADLYVMAYNPTYDRESIRLAASPDGIAWKDVVTLDEMGLIRGQGEIEYSYPTILVQGDVVDLIYTYHRLGIRHLRFNTAWLKERMRD